MRGAIVVVLAGIVVGLVTATAATRVISGLLFQLGATDVVTYAVVGVALLTVATLACFVPARRALDVQPVEALRAR